MSSFEDILQEKGALVYTNVGVSMMPLLRQGRDLMIIERPQGRLKRLDVPLYKREDGRYILHRVLRVKSWGYIICGDNCYTREHVPEDQIIGVLTAVRRRGKDGKDRLIRVTDWQFRLYSHLWCDLWIVRAGLLWFKHQVGRVLRKLGLRA